MTTSSTANSFASETETKPCENCCCGSTTLAENNTQVSTSPQSQQQSNTNLASSATSPTSPEKRSKKPPPSLNIHTIQENARSPQALAEQHREQADNVALKQKRERGSKRRTMPEKCSTMPHMSQLAQSPKAAQS